jgi:CubicO group peptidase (beta-lactamase class C family)
MTDNPTRWSLSIAATFLMALSLPASAQKLVSELDRYLGAQVDALGIPGLTVAVMRADEVIYTGAFGVRELGGDEALTPEHIFHFASVSKPFVATAIMQLVEKGELRLDDRVIEHLPYFRLDDGRYGLITVRQMLDHTSGMPDEEDYEWGKPEYDEAAAERYVRQIASEELLWAPGEGRSYSNMAFDALGDLIAKVSGVPFEQYMKGNILQPLGMNRSSFLYPEIDESVRTTGHVDDPARVSDVYPYNRRHAPSSTLNSSVVEMTRWLRANLRRGELDGVRILEESNYDLLWNSSGGSVAGFNVGLSWFLGELGGARIVYHQGGDTGFSSIVVLVPDEATGVVIASNWEKADTWSLACAILERVLVPPPD